MSCNCGLEHINYYKEKSVGNCKDCGAEGFKLVPINIEELKKIVKKRSAVRVKFDACGRLLHEWGTRCGQFDSVVGKKLWCSHCYQNRLDFLRGDFNES